MLAALTEKLTARQDLSESDIASACECLLDEKESVSSRAAFLRALHLKGETPGEIAGFVRVLLLRALRPSISGNGLLDLCGTGGDKLGLFNVSTASMFVVAACGVRVVKHGNRGITSKSGGADVLEALGVRIDHPPARAGAILDQAGCLFLFAPHYHPAFKAVVPVRQALAAEGSPSIFNILGPLLNPAVPDFQLAGVFNESLLPIYAGTFGLLGRLRAWAVHGQADGRGLDELSTLGPTRVLSVGQGTVDEFLIHPGDLGISPPSLDDLRGGAASHNAALILDILSGPGTGPAADIVLLNAAAALVVAGRAAALPDALSLAREALRSGAAGEVLARLRAAS